nr:MAG TPA: hypothetical protein [Caudoviricetes sp.]
MKLEQIIETLNSIKVNIRTLWRKRKIDKMFKLLNDPDIQVLAMNTEIDSKLLGMVLVSDMKSEKLYSSFTNMIKFRKKEDEDERSFV